jgi:hypothetical protein
MHVPPLRQAVKEPTVVVLGWVTIMTAGADHDQRSPSGDGLDEPVDALVRCQPTDE